MENGLTREQVKWIQNARSIVVSIDNETGKAEVRCNLTVRDRIAGEAEVSREFHTDGSVNTRYYGEDREYHKACFVSLFPRDGGWSAVRAILRPGDVITFRARDNRNEYLKRAEIPSDSWPDDKRYFHPHYHGLHHDELVVGVYRRGKEIVRGLVVEDSISPDNTARRLT